LQVVGRETQQAARKLMLQARRRGGASSALQLLKAELRLQLLLGSQRSCYIAQAQGALDAVLQLPHSLLLLLLMVTTLLQHLQQVAPSTTTNHLLNQVGQKY